MIDIHSHILPGIDDGAKDMEDAIALLQLQKWQGADKIVATPHFSIEHTDIAGFCKARDNSYAQLKDALRSVDPESIPEIYLGSEVMLTEGLSREKGLNRLCMPDGKHLLIELPEYSWGDWIYTELFRISALHLVIPTIAHIERYLMTHRDANVQRLIDLNFPLQFNVDVFEDKKLLKKFMKYYNAVPENFCYLASDCHSAAKRPPEFDKYQKKMCKKLGQDQLDYIERCSEQLLAAKES